MTDTPKTASDAIVTEAPNPPTSPPKDPSEERPLPVGDPDVVTSPRLSEKAPAPVKI